MVSTVVWIFDAKNCSGRDCYWDFIYLFYGTTLVLSGSWYVLLQFKVSKVLIILAINTCKCIYKNSENKVLYFSFHLTFSLLFKSILWVTQISISVTANCRAWKRVSFTVWDIFCSVMNRQQAHLPRQWHPGHMWDLAQDMMRR